MFPPTKRFDIFSPCLGILIRFGFVQTFLYTRIQIATKSLPGKTNREHEEILHKPFGRLYLESIHLVVFAGIFVQDIDSPVKVSVDFYSGFRSGNRENVI